MALLLCVCALWLTAGCSSKQPDPPPAPPPVVEAVEDKRTPVVGAKTLEDGRKVGGVARGKIGDELINTFFSFRVEKAELTAVFEGQQPFRGFVYLVADITVKNTFDESIPMWSDDFLVQWGSGDREYCYPLSKAVHSQMDDEYLLSVNGSVTKKLVFEVPVPEEDNEYNLSYQEYYEDEVEGNIYYIVFTLSI